MPIKQYWSIPLLQRDHHGFVTTAELIESFLSVSADDRYDEVRYVLCNWQAVHSYAIEPVDIAKLQAIIATIELSNPHVRCAHYGFAGDEMRTLANLYEALADDSKWDVKVLDGRGEAEGWLMADGGLSQAQLQACAGLADAD